ncbi:septum formation initiator family protein [Sulfuriroseicoccus oceanibius]|uniref:Septum formation initiator family protein n=1 Tax=Sulfuriroseicoccus oceanibius TaxID=2707525 RepID=A0A6B3L2I3_9BACT|nr:septum formation initiator family protein [Sulfuriroseicoccus oceanibius]QQL43985.1 septum formation initiator family protein [Sulfuriroseicoccus oceanibius]
MRRRSGGAVWGYLWGIAKFALVVGCIALGVARFLPKREADERSKQALAEVEKECAELRAQAAKEKRVTERLRYDDGYLEVVARDRLNLQKPGEQVIRFNEVPQGE